MPKRNLIPWKKEEAEVPVKQTEDPIVALQQDMNRMFDDFFTRGVGMRPFGLDRKLYEFQPRVDVVDGEKEVKVTAELPGLGEDQIELTLHQNTLQISGEKVSESENKGQNYYKMERSYGSFRRSIPLPCEVSADKIEASFSKGVLTVVLPKVVEARQSKRISIKR